MNEFGGIQSQVFRPLPDLLRSGAIVERLTTAISLGLLRHGDQLPVENQLTAMFGVATATVRDALQTLRDSGIIETRRGRSGGTFIIGTPHTAPEVFHQRLCAMSMADLRDLADEHVATSMAAISLAAERALPQDCDRLEHIAEMMREATTTTACLRADSRFQIEIAVFAQSERLMATQMRLLTESVEIMWSVLNVETDRERTLADHLRIVEALRRHDVDAAHATIRDHVSNDFYRLVAARLDMLYPIGGHA